MKNLNIKMLLTVITVVFALLIVLVSMAEKPALTVAVIAAALLSVGFILIPRKILSKNKKYAKYLSSFKNVSPNISGSDFDLFIVGKMYEMDRMTKEQFVTCAAYLLEKHNFTDVKKFYGAGDGERDIEALLGGETYIVKCFHSSGPVDGGPVEKFIAARPGNMKTLVMSNNHFSENAMNAAINAGAQLWDRTMVEAVLKFIFKNKINAVNRLES
ncbi:MAG: restriction endonuclease [Oscillospiraceae bacterium]|nr:restriction endonuclease [Oscillospiraceae bacterium]